MSEVHTPEATPETIYARDMRNTWKGETLLPVGQGKDGKARLLQVTTVKVYSGELVTNAMLVKDEGRGAISYVPSKDYFKCLCRTRVRVTEKAVRAQHDHYTDAASLDILVREAKAHHAKELA